MTLEDLRVLVAVGESGSQSAVARRLGCTQPAVSQHISRLERELGVNLFERSAQGVTLTEAGAALMNAARESLNTLAAGVNRVEEIKGETSRTLTLTTGGTSVRHFLRDSVVRFRRHHPCSTLRFIPSNTTDRCLELVRSGRADLALVTVHGNQAGIEHREVARQDLRLLLPRNDPLAARKRIRLRELDGLPFIGLSVDTTSGGYLDETFEQSGVQVDQFMTVDDFDTACVFVELGLGYTIVPAVHAANFSKSAQVTSKHVSGLPALPIGLAARKWVSLPAIAHTFFDVFIDELRKMSRLPGIKLTPA